MTLLLLFQGEVTPPVIENPPTPPMVLFGKSRWLTYSRLEASSKLSRNSEMKLNGQISDNIKLSVIGKLGSVKTFVSESLLSDNTELGIKSKLIGVKDIATTGQVVHQIPIEDFLDKEKTDMLRMYNLKFMLKQTVLNNLLAELDAVDVTSD
jgi:hypothetical protein